MSETIETLPDAGVTFWPVGNGDSTTVSICGEYKLQIDIHHMSSSGNEEEEAYPVVDHLLESLPTRNNKPYLATFALTHPDEDHIKGFSQLLEAALIGELWFTPRIFNEYRKELCPEAEAFRNEAERRLKLVIENNGDVESGDRIRIFGYDSLLEEAKYSGLPKDLLTIPGQEVSIVDGKDLSETFSSFVHTPFKADEEDERNDTSLGMQISLGNEDEKLKILVFGDLSHDSLRKVIDISKESGNEEKMQWNILLAPHHCSKSVMYTKDEQDDIILQREMMDDLESLALEPGYVISSSKSVPRVNEKGDNPPHALAKARYEEIVPDEFLCTHSESGEEAQPIVFEKSKLNKLILNGSVVAQELAPKSLDDSINDARGHDAPPSKTAGFGAYIP